MKTVSPQSSPETTDQPEVRILKIASCPSLSGKSTLTYHIGSTGTTDVLFGVIGNTGGGFFSQEMVALSAIGQMFSKVPKGISITAHLLSPLYQGKSANSHAFLFAALKNEGLVRPMKDKKGSYECTDASGFMAEVKALMAASDDLKVKAPAAKASTEAKKSPKKTVAPAAV